MKKFLIAFILSVFIIQTAPPAFCITSDSFNLAGVIESIINYQNKADFIQDVEESAKENYLYAAKNFLNGNVTVAYSEYSKTIDKIDSNISLLMFSKKLYEYGIFSLADKALSKISKKDKMKTQIEDLKKAYKPSYELSKEEEIYLTKIYASIFYNNSPEEAAFDLIKKTTLLENSDYANYIMALSMFECKQYNQAVNYVNKAIEKNAINSNYKYFKARALLMAKNYKEAIKYIDENSDSISIYFSNDFKILKEQILSAIAANDSDKKYHKIYAYYLEGNYYKVLKETQNILNFYKNSPKILTLQGMAYLATGDTDAAYKNFVLSYKQNKKFDLTLMGLADCDFINRNYKEAYSKYKELFKTEYKKEALLKAEITLENMNDKEKKIAKLNKYTNTFKNSAYFEYYNIANNIISDDDIKKEYAAKSLEINFLNKNAWDILFKIDYKNKDFESIKKIVSSLLFMGDTDERYYYYSAVALDSDNNKKEAFYEVKKSVNLNSDYKPAIDFMNKLENELI